MIAQADHDLVEDAAAVVHAQAVDEVVDLEAEMLIFHHSSDEHNKMQSTFQS
jgi:putative NIF3 family GTP cyclohydrolase 1 type 2